MEKRQEQNVQLSFNFHKCEKYYWKGRAQKARGTATRHFRPAAAAGFLPHSPLRERGRGGVREENSRWTDCGCYMSSYLLVSQYNMPLYGHWRGEASRAKPRPNATLKSSTIDCSAPNWSNQFCTVLIGICCGGVNTWAWKWSWNLNYSNTWFWYTIYTE